MKKIIGREEEKRKLTYYYELDNSEFLVVYGRRRVGKTYLILKGRCNLQHLTVNHLASC